MTLQAEIEHLIGSLRSALDEGGVRVALAESVLVAVLPSELEARTVAAEKAGVPREAVCLEFVVRLEQRGGRFGARYVVGQGQDLLAALSGALDMAGRIGWLG